MSEAVVVRTLRRSIAGAAVVVAIALKSVLAPTAPARAESCTSSGLQPRVLVSDDPGFIETQYCLAGEWVTSSRMQVVPDRLVVDEKVWDPRDDRYRLSEAEEFFGLKSVRPYQVAKDAKGLLAGVLDKGDMLELRLALADSRAQAVLNRQGTRRSDNCQTRPVQFALADERVGRWHGPDSVGSVDEPSYIDFDFSPGLPNDLRAIVLNAIDQYPAAVAAQDPLGMYPSRIVPHDPSDSNPATVTFAWQRWDGKSLAMTTADLVTHRPDGTQVWSSGTIFLSDRITPAMIVHEIGHMLGLRHSASVWGGTMNANTMVRPWNSRTPIGEGDALAFDECMFLPPIQPR